MEPLKLSLIFSFTDSLLTLLTFSQFTCLRDDERLFEPVDYRVAEGDLIQVVGPNGAGKTTLLRSICGLFADFQGQITWCGQPLDSSGFDFLQRLFYLGHYTGVKKSLTAAENLRWYFDLHSGSSEIDVNDLLTKVGLAGYGDTPCQQMSAGQMRRVALARLYGTTRQLWILDEPFTAIDVGGVAQLELLLQSHCHSGGTVILTTHQALSLTGVRSLVLTPSRVCDE